MKCQNLALNLDVKSLQPRQLHDSFITLEAMSSMVGQSRGTGLHIWYGVHDTAFGACVIATTDQGVCNLSFWDESNSDAARQYLQLEWPNAEITCDRTKTEYVGDRLFQPPSQAQPSLILQVKGTDFQLQVWRSLLKIPFAEKTTYQGLATAMGKPTAARAIGNAIGRNPIAYLIPCHRVIRQSGELGGYRWGLDRKTALLDWEARVNAT